VDAPDDDPSHHLLGHSITYRIAVGPQQGRKVFTLQTLPSLESDNPFSGSVGEAAGFSLHAGVATKANERAKLECLCRYITRPAVSTKRLSMTRNGRVRYKLKTPWRNGTTHVIFEPDYHPHLHVVVPGGGINKATRQWKKTRGKFLFNKTALAKVFRARLLAAIRTTGLTLPGKVPDEWVVDCRHVGKGAPALKYLSRYLYRGVISENNIVVNHNGKVTFKYIDGNTGQIRYRKLEGQDFLWLVLQHVLPKGFRRVRDYGFLHGNASKLLVLIQLTLKVMITIMPARPRPVFSCPRCQSPMRILGFIRPAWSPG